MARARLPYSGIKSGFLQCQETTNKLVAQNLAAAIVLAACSLRSQRCLGRKERAIPFSVTQSLQNSASDGPSRPSGASGYGGNMVCAAEHGLEWPAVARNLIILSFPPSLKTAKS